MSDWLPGIDYPEDIHDECKAKLAAAYARIEELEADLRASLIDARAEKADWPKDA